MKRWRVNRMEAVPRGRPVERIERSLREAVLGMFALMGPSLGLPALVDLFPDAARAELAELQGRWREAFKRKNRLLIYALRWTRPRAVWAMDFSEPPRPVDGVYRWLLAVRELGSGKVLLSMGCEAPTAEVAMWALRALFVELGLPLVIKMDNGSAFIAGGMKALLARFGVLALYSPRETPRFNGSIEAGIGGLKTRAHYESARHDRPGEWTSDDLEAARCQGNELIRPGGEGTASAGEKWEQAEPITIGERAGLQWAYVQRRKEEEGRREVRQREVMTHSERSSIDRMAISRGLIDCGLLQVRRRRISPPFMRQKSSRIT